MTIRRCTGIALSITTLILAFTTHARHARAEGDLPAPLPPPTTAPAALPPPPSPDPAATASPSQSPSTPVATAPGTSSLRLTYEATRVDRPAESPPAARSPDDYSILHGFRLGYGYVANYDEPSPAFDGQSIKQRLGLRSPHHFLLGYEVVYRVVTHSWLNVLLLGNAIVAGLEQSKVLPSANLLIGFELKNTFQIGVGANLSPIKGSEGHTIVAAGWTPKVGTVYTPVHFFFIPDVDGNHRMGVTTGVTF